MDKNQGRHHGRGRARFPQLQLSLPRQREIRRRRLHRDPDPRHRGPGLSAGDSPGSLYPEGIPILPEDELERIIREHDVDEVWFSYSDVPHTYVMNKASEVIGWGPHFGVCSATRTMVESTKPLIAITAVRTGVGKSQTTRYVSRLLKKLGQAGRRHSPPHALRRSRQTGLPAVRNL